MKPGRGQAPAGRGKAHGEKSRRDEKERKPPGPGRTAARSSEREPAGGKDFGVPADLHVPVLLQEVLSFLEPADGQRYLDATLGLGGHSEAMLQKVAQAGAAPPAPPCS